MLFMLKLRSMQPTCFVRIFLRACNAGKSRLKLQCGTLLQCHETLLCRGVQALPCLCSTGLLRLDLIATFSSCLSWMLDVTVKSARHRSTSILHHYRSTIWSIPYSTLNNDLKTVPTKTDVSVQLTVVTRLQLTTRRKLAPVSAIMSCRITGATTLCCKYSRVSTQI